MGAPENEQTGPPGGWQTNVEEKKEVDKNYQTNEEEENPNEKNTDSPMNRAGASNYFKNHRESIIESVQEDERARESFKSKLEDINNNGSVFWGSLLARSLLTVSFLVFGFCFPLPFPPPDIGSQKVWGSLLS